MSTVTVARSVRVPRWLVLGFVTWAAVELLALWAVAHLIGWGWAILAVIAVSFVGMSLTRRQFVRSWRELRAGGVATRIGDEVVVSPVDAEHIGRSTVSVAAGLLLSIPGFISALLGLLLLVPFVRRPIGARLARSTTVRSVSSASGRYGAATAASVDPREQVRDGMPVLEGEIVED